MTRRAAIPAVLLLAALGTSACNRHSEPVSYVCHTPKGVVKVSTERGAIAMARIGIAPERLKNEQSCH
jgi:hypothetical protein